jgi:hypothetical protein
VLNNILRPTSSYYQSHSLEYFTPTVFCMRAVASAAAAVNGLAALDELRSLRSLRR